MSSSGKIYIEEYSAKSFVVRGDTQPHKDNLKALGGKWGSNFTDKNSGEKFGAWLFWTAKKEEVKNWISSGCKNVSSKKEINTPNNTPRISSSVNQEDHIKNEVIMEIINILASMDIKHEQKLKNTQFYKIYSKKNTQDIDYNSGDEYEEESTTPPKRLLRR
jgi:hypothetical protein